MSDTCTSIVDEFLNSLDLTGMESLENILDYILAKARRLTLAEAGTVFICDPFLTGQLGTLTCLVAQNDEVEIEQETFTVPINLYSVAGYTASKCEALNIADVYNLDAKAPYEFNASFDRRYGYQSVSMLSVPLKNFKNDVIGVIQLLNHLPPVDSQEKYSPFRAEDVQNMESLSLILGMMIERAALLEEVSRLRQRG